MDYSNVPIRYVTGVEPATPPPRPPVDLVAVALFAVAGALLGIAFSIIYVGVNYLNVLGVQWKFIWE